MQWKGMYGGLGFAISTLKRERLKAKENNLTIEGLHFQMLNLF